MKETKVTAKLTLRHVGAFFALSAFPALAQSGHTINSIDTRPGTSAPSNPMAPGNSTGSHAADQNTGTSMSKATADLPKDAGASTGERKASRGIQPKKRANLNKVNRGDELPFSNEREPRLPTTPPVTQQ